jgi:hypothetical protein
MRPVRSHDTAKRKRRAFDSVTVSCFRRSVWADPFDPPRPEPRHDPHDAGNGNAVTIDRRVTDTGYVEVTSHV